MPDTKITALTAISTVDPAVDVLPIVDVSDTTMAASGTTKKITTNQILGAGGTATLASATVTGAATAARLIVTGSTIPANGVYLPAANTVGFAANSLDQYRIEPLGIFTWYDGAGGTRMTLNSTGLGLGVTPSAWATNRRPLQIGGLASGAVALNGTAGSGEIFFNSFFNASSQNICVVTGGTGKYDFNVSTAGCHTWSVGTGTAGNSFTFTPAMTLDASGNLILQSSATPATLTVNGQLTVNATSNTNLRFSYRGSDGTTRVANITLA
jgi:hypothetical protein